MSYIPTEETSYSFLYTHPIDLKWFLIYPSIDFMCLITQLCPTLCDSTDCSLPGSSVHGGSPGKNTGVGCHALIDLMLMLLSRFSRVRLFATPQTVAHQGPLSMGVLQARILEWVAIPFSRGSSQPRD